MKKNTKFIRLIAMTAISSGILLSVSGCTDKAIGDTTESTENILTPPSETNNTYVMIADEYFDDNALSKLYDEEESFIRLCNLNDDLNKYFDYYELSFQALQSLEYYNLDDEFVKIYNRKGGKIENQIVGIEEEERYVTSLNTIIVNENFFETYLDSIEQGEKFTDDDYILSMSEDIPILLGYNYMSYFDIGDTLELNYLGSNLTFYIKGFLTENLSIKKDNNIISLDNYICVPSFKIKSEPQRRDSEQDTLFKMRYYLQKNSGYIQFSTDDEIEQIVQQINDFNSKYDLDYTVLNTTYNIGVN